MNLEPRRGPVFALLCDKQSGALELGLPVEFASSRVVWPNLCNFLCTANSSGLRWSKMAKLCPFKLCL